MLARAFHGSDRAFATDKKRRVQGRQRNVQGGVRCSINGERKGRSRGSHREVTPGVGGERRAGDGALRGVVARHLDKGHALVQADHKGVAAVPTAEHHGVGLRRGKLDPGGPRHRGAVGPHQRGRGLHDEGAPAVKTHAAADHRAFRQGADAAGVVARNREVIGGLTALGEMVDERGVGVVGALGVVGLDGLGAGVAVVKPEGRLGSGLEVGAAHPDERLVEQRVVALDVERQQGLVVFGDEPDVGAVFLRQRELEVARMQADEHRHRAGHVGQGHAGGRSVERDLFAHRPVAVPPRMGRAGEGDGDEAAEKQTFKKGGLCWFHNRGLAGWWMLRNGRVVGLQ